MKTITTKKLERVEAPAGDEAIAYQVVEFTISYYGNEIKTSHDTAIYADGRQLVIGGCGFIPHGYQVN